MSTPAAALVESPAVGVPGPWVLSSEVPQRPPVAARRAPIAYAFVLLHPIPTLVFTLWAVDGLLHCDEAERVTCNLGFAIHLLFPAAVGVVVAIMVGVIGLTVRPTRRLEAWLWLLVPTTLTWLTLWCVLALTAQPGPAPWADALGP